MSSSRSSCSEMDMMMDLSAMISATMSRISSRAASWSMVASWLRSIESISALKMADLVWKYSLSRCAASGLRTSMTSSLRFAGSGERSNSVRAAGTTGATGGRGAGMLAPGVLPPKLVRLPNIRGLSGALLQERGELEARLAGGAFRRGAAGDVHADGAEHLVGAVVGGDFGDHLAVIGRSAEGLRVETELAEQL